MAKKTLSFEESMQRLEEIVRLLERGDVPLEASLALFEEGSGLIAQCSKLLDSAEPEMLPALMKEAQEISEKLKKLK